MSPELKQLLEACLPLLDDGIDERRMQRSRVTPPEQRLLSAGRLYDAQRQRMLAGIRAQHPEFDSTAIDAEFRRRCKIARQIADQPIDTWPTFDSVSKGNL